MKTLLTSSVSVAVLSLFLSAPAFAADLGGSAKDSPSSILDLPIAKNWQGPYIGAFGGWGWGSVDQRELNGGVDHEASYDPDGVFGGVTVGYNVQFKNIVAGVEVEGGWMDAKGDGKMDSSNPHADQNLELEGGFYGLVAGRLGIAIDRTLIYGKGGWAYFDGEASQDSTNPHFDHSTKGTDAFSGFAYGGGVEQKIGTGLSVKVEYLHFDFGKENGSQTEAGVNGFKFDNESKLEMDTIKLGLNYAF